MTLPTYLLAGLIIGRVTGNYPAAIIDSAVIDLDHLVSYYRHGVIFNPQKLFNTILREADPWEDQRSLLHSFLTWSAVSTVLLLFNLRFGAVFSVAYFSHLAIDMLDSADFWPFFPSKQINIRGPIKYFSKQEIILDVILLVVFIFSLLG